MTKIIPDRQLAILHDAYGKHAPVPMGHITVNGHRYNQYACSCGYKFWDSRVEDGTPNTPRAPLETEPNSE